MEHAGTIAKMFINKSKLEKMLDDACIAYKSGLFEVKIVCMPDTTIDIVSGDWVKIYGCDYNGVFEYSPEYAARILHKKFGRGLQISKMAQPDRTIHCTVDGLIRMLNPEYFESFKKLCKRAKMRVPEQEVPEDDYDYIVRLWIRHSKCNMDK